MEELNVWTHPLTPRSPSGREALYGSCYIDLQCSNRIWCCLGPLSASGREYMPPTRSPPCRNSPNTLHSTHIQQSELSSLLHIVYSIIYKLYWLCQHSFLYTFTVIRAFSIATDLTSLLTRQFIEQTYS